MSGSRYLPRTRQAPATALLALGVVTSWALWLAWDVHRDVDATGHATGPYEPWQVAGYVLCLVAVVVAATRRLPFVAVLVTTPAVITAVWTVSAALLDGEGDGLWPIGAMLVLVGSVCATVLLGGAADVVWTRRWRHRHPHGTAR